jgi:drug/metabolite transporter (DMT)-like permease
MSAALVALVLLAALLHASWNALQKSAADPEWAKVLYGPASVVMLAPLTLLVPFPQASVWPWLLGGSLLHVTYAVLLYWAFEHGELGEIYPISRGASPVMVTAGGVVFAHDLMGAIQVAGVIAVCGGIIALRRSGGRALPRKGLVLALLTAASTAGYTVVDGIGARLSDDRYGFIVWLFLVNAIGSGAFFWAFQRPANLRSLPPGLELIKALAIPVVSMTSFGMIIVATTLGPLGAISALRETSVVFAAILGWQFLGEKFSPRRIAACVAVAAGAAMVALG